MHIRPLLWKVPVRPAHLQIDLGAIAHNVTVVRDIVGAQVAIIAVVKADAYGHGAVPVARTCMESGAEMLAVALLEEGIELRQNGLMADILVMGAMLPEQAEELVRWDLTPAIMNFDLAYAVSKAATAQGKTISAHLKVDTGMTRLGTRLDELPELAGRLAPLPSIRWQGIFSHLADPTDAEGYTAMQAENFKAAIGPAQVILGSLPYRHLCSSGGICLYSEYAFTAVRPGEMLYGLVAGVPEDRMPDLREAMSLHTKIVFLKRVYAGEKVSYGGTWTAPHDTTLAVIPIGYADGYPRSLSSAAQVLIGGRRRDVVGRVCMDCILADVGPEADCCVGDEVVVFGKQGTEEVRISEISERGQTINQEIVARMGGRLPRVYLTA
ncbi:MAG: alanine racemase [Bacteroidota bacterium]